MCTGQINQFNGAIVRLQMADVPLDSHARIVTDPLTHSGQPIEQRALATIRVTDNRYAGIGLPAYGDVC